MVTIISGLVGFLGAMLPEILKFWQDKADRGHELAILDRQLQMQESGRDERLSQLEAHFAGLQATALYQTWKSDIGWVDALNGSVRPVLAYAFFLLYGVLKLLLIARLDWVGLPPSALIETLWSDEDQAIFASIISFYFGQRAFRKVRGKA